MTSGIRHPKHFYCSNRDLKPQIARNYLADSAERFISVVRKVIFADGEHKFAVHEHMFKGGEHKYVVYEFKILYERKKF